MRLLVSFAGLLVAFAGSHLHSGATAQEPSLKEQLIGTWMLVSWEQMQPDGTKFRKYGDDPRGFHIFERNGRFFAMMARPDLPKLSAADPQKATPEEARAIMAGSIAYYGTYVVNEAERMVTLRMEFEHVSQSDRPRSSPAHRIGDGQRDGLRQPNRHDRRRPDPTELEEGAMTPHASPC